MQLFENRLFACFLVTTILGAGIGLGPIANPAIAKTKVKEEKKRSPEKIIRSNLQELANHATNRDAAAMAILWSENATYVDEDGEATIGRDALKNRFDQGFRLGEPVTITLKTENLSFLGDESAVARGIVEKVGDTAFPFPATRFMMIFKKENGKWLISNATETTIQKPTKNDLLKEVSWLIGTWKAQRDKATVGLTARWIGKGNFMLLSFVIEKPGQSKVKEAQIIGWDPIEHRPISWSFDSDGGFGNGHWFKQNNQWHVEVSGVHSDGSETNAVNVFTLKDNDNFTWKSTSRTIGDEPLPDSAVIKVQRIK